MRAFPLPPADSFDPCSTDLQGVFLGSAPNQHAAIRPFLDRIYGTTLCDNECRKVRAATLAQSATDFIAAQGDVFQPASVGEWTHNVLFGMTFPNKTNPIPWGGKTGFGQLQKMASGVGSLAVLFSKEVSDVITTPVSFLVEQAFAKYKRMTLEIYGGELAPLEAVDACAPNSCLDQLTGAILDALMYAGGLSVPSILQSGLWVLHGDKSAYGDLFPKTNVLTQETAGQFAWEATRFFPAVISYPYWEKGATPPVKTTVSRTARAHAQHVRQAVVNLHALAPRPDVVRRVCVLLESAALTRCVVLSRVRLEMAAERLSNGSSLGSR